MNKETNILKLHYDIHEPIDAERFLNSFSSFVEEYSKYINRRKDEISEEDYRLYISSIKDNCILVDLAPAADILGSLMSVRDHLTVLMDFAKYFDDIFDYFKSAGRKDQKDIKAEDIPYNKTSVQHFRSFCDVVKNNGQINISVAEYEDGEVKARFEYNNKDIQTAQIGAEKSLYALDLKSDVDYRNVVMFLQQSNTDDSKLSGTTAEKAKIAEISDKPLKVFFASEGDTMKIREFKDKKDINLFRIPFVVNVNVQLNPNGNPICYRVLSIVDILMDEIET